MFDWIVSLLARGGYVGVAGLMFAENVFPPIPSELVMPLSGYLAAQETLALIPVILAGTLGSVAGAVLWYWIGLRIGQERLKRFARNHGKWLTLSPEDVDGASRWFRDYGWRAVFFGRMVPGVRTFISVPAGVARMPIMPFLAFTTVGSAIWTTLLAYAGYLLESQYEKVADWLNPISTAIVVGIVGYYIFRVIRQSR